jgi:hypothetical protein
MKFAHHRYIFLFGFGMAILAIAGYWRAHDHSSKRSETARYADGSKYNDAVATIRLRQNHYKPNRQGLDGLVATTPVLMPAIIVIPVSVTNGPHTTNSGTPKPALRGPPAL